MYNQKDGSSIKPIFQVIKEEAKGKNDVVS